MCSVAKTIHLCYGHRLLGHQGKCRHLHGHNARAVIRLESETLDRLGLVVDFKDIGDYVKSWLDAEIDHTMLLKAECCRSSSSARFSQDNPRRICRIPSPPLPRLVSLHHA